MVVRCTTNISFYSSSCTWSRCCHSVAIHLSTVAPLTV